MSTSVHKLKRKLDFVATFNLIGSCVDTSDANLGANAYLHIFSNNSDEKYKDKPKVIPKGNCHLK